MAENFVKGDTVRLKSGGPVMTIKDIETEDGATHSAGDFQCVWFEKNKQFNGCFDPITVSKVVPPKAGIYSL